MPSTGKRSHHSLAFSFAFYGLIRKIAHVDAIPGLAIESLILLLPALAWLGWAGVQGVGEFGNGNPGSDVLLVIGGALTALPLIGFAYAVRRIPLSTVGLLQYVAPTLQFLIGVLVFKEAFDATRAIGFAAIWAGLVIFASDGLWRARRRDALIAAPSSK